MPASNVAARFHNHVVSNSALVQAGRGLCIAVTAHAIPNILAIAVATRLWGGAPYAPGLATCPSFASTRFFSQTREDQDAVVPVVFGLVIFILLTTWKRGRELLGERLAADAMQLRPFIASIAEGGVERVPGTAVFMTPDPESVPHALLHSLKHYKALHEQVIILCVKVFDGPTCRR